MTDFSDKLEEIERNIQEGQAMLSALRKLPESEEINAQIQRFEELVQRLEEYREQYKMRQSMSLSDLDSQLEALKDRHERIKELLEQTSVKGLLDLSQSSENGQSSSAQPEQVLKANKLQKTTSSDRECIEQLENDSYTLDPAEWRLHYEAQTSQLSEMLSEIARCQVMLGRLSDNLIKYDLTSTVNLLSAVGQSFTGVHLKLHFLKKSYEEFLNQENKTDEYIISQLKHLRASLIAAKISLTVNKDNFLSIADTIKKALDSRNEGNSTEDVDKIKNVPGEQVRPGGDEVKKSAEEEEEAKMQQEIVDLRRKRDFLIAKLAEARAVVNSTSGSSPVANASSLNVSVDDNNHHGGDSSSAKNVSCQNDDSLPILKRLQAQKQHIDELRGQLSSFNFSSDDEDDVEERTGKKTPPPQATSSPLAPKSDVVTFQEPEATYLDSTERLYQSMREARIRRAVDGISTSVANGTGGGGLSECASYLDAATAAATYGGDSDRGPVDDVEGGVLNLPQVGLSPSPRSIDIRSLASDLARLEFKVEQLSQTCHLLVRENAQLSSTLAMLMEARQFNRGLFQPEWMIANSRNREGSVSGLSSIQSLPVHAHSPSLEKALDQVQVLSAQMLEHQARMSQVQAELQMALHQQQQQQSPRFVANGPSTSSAIWPTNLKR